VSYYIFPPDITEILLKVVLNTITLYSKSKEEIWSFNLSSLFDINLLIVLPIGLT
jgi:hypothetical protein